MQFIRILWGDFEKYKHQIVDAKKDNLNEIVFVWGNDNKTKLEELGYECYLVNPNPYDLSIADNHTFINHKSLIHKIVGIKTALEIYEEIIFVDWDCRKEKEIDNYFFELIKSKESKLQVPLYTYPVVAFEMMLNDIKDDVVNNFISKLRDYVEKYSFRYGNNYIIPNTGFFYCGDINIVNKLLELINENDLQTVPDELSVFLFYKDLGLEGYIEKIEPLVIGGKMHGYKWWNSIEDSFEAHKQKNIKKCIYFNHY
jgi:hypothetical protein